MFNILKRLRGSGLAALLSASLAAGAQGLSILPASPQYMEPVYVRITPERGARELIYGAQASMSGNVITVEVQKRSECCEYYYDVMLGRFPAGTYKVVVPAGDGKTATVDFTVSAPARSREYPGRVPAVNYTDLWWSPAESGWGLSIVHGPFNDIFATWMVYGTDGKLFYLVKVDNARFSRMVVPGDRLELDVTLKRTIRNMALYEGIARVDGQVAASAEILCAEVKSEA